MTRGLARALDEAISGPGVVRVAGGDRSVEGAERSVEGAERSVDGAERSVEVEVIEADGLAVRVMRVRVGGEQEGILEAAERLSEAFRGLPERLIPIEIAPALGGAILRSAPEEMQNREYFEARTDGRWTDLERFHALPGGERRPIPFTLTREALARIVGRVSRG